MALSRRNFLAAGFALVQSPALAETADDGFQVLRASKRKLPLLGGEQPASDVWMFDTTVIRAKQGQEFKLRIVNELEEDLWLHWFGVRGPSDVMTLNVMPGEGNAAECVFTPPDAGTFWLGTMAGQSQTRDMGLVAMFIVDESVAVPGLADLPLILDDWKIDDAGVIDPDFGDMNLVVGEGRLGNWFTINGAFRPSLPLAQNAFTRLRLLNAANSRTIPLQFKGDDPLLVALDGQPVKPRNLGQSSLSLAPGQRADLLMGAAPGETRLAIDLFEDLVEIGTLTGGGSQMPEIADNFALPPNPISTAVDLVAAVSLPLVIEGGEKGGLTGALYRGQELDLRGLLEQGMAWAFNGAAGASGAPLGTFKLGGSVVIAIENRTIFEQPIHIHGHVWQEIERGGQGLEGEPFVDTAVIAAKSSAKFALVADNPGTWAIQSLIAERADSGLTVAYVVA